MNTKSTNEKNKQDKMNEFRERISELKKHQFDMTMERFQCEILALTAEILITGFTKE